MRTTSTKVGGYRIRYTVVIDEKGRFLFQKDYTTNVASRAFPDAPVVGKMDMDF